MYKRQGWDAVTSTWANGLRHGKRPPILVGNEGRATSAKSLWSATTFRTVYPNSTNRSKTIWMNIEISTLIYASLIPAVWRPTTGVSIGDGSWRRSALRKRHIGSRNGAAETRSRDQSINPHTCEHD